MVILISNWRSCLILLSPIAFGSLPRTMKLLFFSECVKLMFSTSMVNKILGNTFPRDHTVSSSKVIPL